MADNRKGCLYDYANATDSYGFRRGNILPRIIESSLYDAFNFV